MPIITGAVGIDVGGSRVRGGVVHSDGAVYHRYEEPTVQSDSEWPLINQIERVYRKVHQMAGHDVFGLGVCLPGGINGDKGRVQSLTNITGWNHPVDLVDILHARLPLRTIRIDNDANCAAMGEYRFGAGQGSTYLLYLTLSTGLGGGFIWDGKVLRGWDGTAVEPGHNVLYPGGERCNCGQHGCAEAYISGTALRRIMLSTPKPAFVEYLQRNNIPPGQVSAQTVGEAAESGVLTARWVLGEMGQHLGTLLVSLVNCFNPDRIVLGGSLMKSAEFFLREAEERLRSRAFAQAGDVEIVPATLYESGIVGAAALVGL